MKISVEQEKKGDKVDKLDDTNKSSTKAIPVEEIKSDEFMVKLQKYIHSKFDKLVVKM